MRRQSATMEQEFAILIITWDRENVYSEGQYAQANRLFSESAAFLAVGNGVFLIKVKQAFPVLMTAYANESRHNEFKLRFAVLPCSQTVFGAFLKVEAKVLADFGLTHLDTPIPKAQPPH